MPLIYRYASGYGPPQADAAQITEDMETTYINGKLVATFRRPTTSILEGDDISVDVCRHLIIASGTGYTATGGFSKHDTTPVISEQKYCFLETSSGLSSAAGQSMAVAVLALLALLCL